MAKGKHPHCVCWQLRCGYVACCRCGLLRLNNERTQAALRAACPGKD